MTASFSRTVISSRGSLIDMAALYPQTCIGALPDAAASTAQVVVLLEESRTEMSTISRAGNGIRTRDFDLGKLAVD
jgi:hypothetical protein